MRMEGETVIYDVTDVFTPGPPATHTFVERAAVNEKLMPPLTTPGIQLLVYGHSGGGKTTLLKNKINVLYGNDYIYHQCTSRDTFDQLVLSAFDYLDAYYVEKTKVSSKAEISASLSATYATIKARLGASVSEEREIQVSRLVRPQLTPQQLARLIGAAGCCWVIDDFNKMADAEKAKLADVMKIFVGAASEYPHLKIIAIGAAATPRQVLEYESALRTRTAEVSVPLMSSTEITGIIDKGQALLNFELVSRAKVAVVEYAGGLASAAHHLCLNLCQSKGLLETYPGRNPAQFDTDDLKSAIDMYVNSQSDSLASTFDNALRRRRTRRYDNCRIILTALQSFTQEGAVHNDLLMRIRQDGYRDYPPGNLTHYLRELQTADYGEVVRHDPASGRYSYADPFYRVYAMTLFRDPAEQVDPEKIKAILEKQLTSDLLS